MAPILGERAPLKNKPQPTLKTTQKKIAMQKLKTSKKEVSN
jgi:hypothetical protein